MDARTERRRVWSGVGGLHTDRQPCSVSAYVTSSQSRYG
jgi:hypothetical protein